ncbi:hypothetical protein ACFLR4_05085, partial [Bacteroidota bacterium]
MKQTIFFIVSLFTYSVLSAQSFSLTVGETTAAGDIGSELVFHVTMQNISDGELTLSIKRTIEDHPAEWTSSFCFQSCFPGTVDSISTDASFGSSPLQPGEERELEFHVFVMTVEGNGNYQIEISDLRSGQTETINLSASTTATSIDEVVLPSQSTLYQNYPNPFNPTTIVAYHLYKSSDVEFRIFDILGNVVLYEN